MVRRSSLIIAASLAVLSTYEPGALCFAAAAPAVPPVEDRFDRPRFLKREIKRYYYANTTMSQSQSTTEEQSTTPINVPPDVTPTTHLAPDLIAASISAASLASAEASWSAAHPGVPFGETPPDTTNPPTPSTTHTPEGGATTPSESQTQASSSPPVGLSATESVGVSLPLPSSSGESEASAQGPSTRSAVGESTSGGNQPGSTPSSSTGAPVIPPFNGQTTHSPPVGQSTQGVPVESGSPHTSGSAQETGGQQTGGQQTGGQQTGGQQTGGQETGGQFHGGQQTGGEQTTPTGGFVVPIPSVTQSVIPGQSEASVLFGSTHPANPETGGPQPASTRAGQPVQTAVPVSGPNGGVSAGSTPTEAPGSLANPVFPLPTSNTHNLIAALSSALAVSESQSAPLVVQPGQSSGAPIAIGSTTNAAGVVVPVTPSTPVEATGVVPSVVGSTNGEGKVVPVTAPPVSGSVLPPNVGLSTESNGNVVPISGSAPPVSGSVAPAIIGSSTNAQGQVVPITSTPPNQGSVAPAIVGSSTNAQGQVVPITSTPHSEGSGAPVIVGSSTNSLGQVVPITSSPGAPASNDRFAQQSTGQPVSGPQESGNAASNSIGSQSAQQSGVGASESAGSQVAGSATPAGQPTGSVVPAPSTAGAVGSPSSPTAAQLPVATASQTYNTEQNAPLTQRPTAYDSMTSQPVASSIEMASSSSPTATSEYSETGLPTGVPLVLYPPTGPVNRPENTELIQIGFLYPLNYDFVWQHQESQRQIFTYLPMGISYGLDINVSNVTMQTLRAWDTTQDLHYITTLALAWIPSQLVDSLGLILHTQAEKFYHNPDPAVRTLLSMINPALPIRADNSTDGGTGTGVGASPSGTNSANGGTIANGINSSSPVKASSVGIGVGVVCGAAAYGAAMFFVARRYKKRRQSHLRSPSMYSSPVMSHHGADPAAGAALMSGGMGERSISPYYDNDRGPSRGSGRSGSSAGRQQISAPVMAENSLGWN